MRRQSLIQVAWLLALGLLLWRLVVAPFQHNLAQVMANRAFSSGLATSSSMTLLQTALSLDCAGNGDCGLEAMATENSILQTAKEQYIPDPTPILIISDSVRIPSDQFVPFGLPDALQNVDEPGVLYGPGTLKIRLFVVSEYESCWRIAVQAKHDDPPPVNLEVWLDRDRVDTLSYARGDRSWQELSVNTLIGRNLHTLGITFANDYLDKETGADRNAYIEHVEITRLEGSFCESG